LAQDFMADPSNSMIHLVILRVARLDKLQTRVIVLMKGAFSDTLVRNNAKLFSCS
jgi:hypothetical protein